MQFCYLELCFAVRSQSGLQREQCFDINIPETEITFAVVGGGKTSEYITEEQLEKLERYFKANLLLVNCLNLAVVSDREGIENSLLTL